MYKETRTIREVTYLTPTTAVKLQAHADRLGVKKAAVIATMIENWIAFQDGLLKRAEVPLIRALALELGVDDALLKRCLAQKLFECTVHFDVLNSTDIT